MAKIKIEIADSPMQLAQGLMHRDKLDADSGMLFKFRQAAPVAFWGKNTYIPLDVAFIESDKTGEQKLVISEIKHIAPMSTKMIHSTGNCSMALEANAGYFSQNNIVTGSSVKLIKDDSGKEVEIEF